MIRIVAGFRGIIKQPHWSRFQVFHQQINRMNYPAVPQSLSTFINEMTFEKHDENAEQKMSLPFLGELDAREKKGEKSRIMFLQSENSCQNALENEIESRLFLLIFIVCHLNVNYVRNAIYIKFIYLLWFFFALSLAA